MPAQQTVRFAPTLRQWWQENRRHNGLFRALRRLAGNLWEFVRDSTSARRKNRYGDIDYDWDNRVDTTAATVSWRDRFLGLFHSPYQPTEPVLFRDMIESLAIDFSKFTFIDIGSGKGRTLLMASDFPFRRIIGVEILPDLHRIAEENVRKYKSDSQKCFAIETISEDARKFVFPPESMMLYLFNPLPEPGLVQLIANLEKSLSQHPRHVYVLYHNPLLEGVLAKSKQLTKVSGTHQYSIYANHSQEADFSSAKFLRP
jgi:SAM-dependent methyltransferase